MCLRSIGAFIGPVAPFHPPLPGRRKYALAQNESFDCHLQIPQTVHKSGVLDISIRVEQIDRWVGFVDCGRGKHTQKGSNPDSSCEENGRSCNIVMQTKEPIGPRRRTSVPSGKTDRARLKSESRIRVTTRRSEAKQELAIENVWVRLFKPRDGSPRRIRSINCPGRNKKLRGL